MRHRSMLPLLSSELMSRRSLDRSECRDRSKATVQFQVLECWWRPSKVHHQLPNAGAAERGQAASWRTWLFSSGWAGYGAWVSQLMMTGWIRRNYKSARGNFSKRRKNIWTASCLRPWESQTGLTPVPSHLIDSKALDPLRGTESDKQALLYWLHTYFHCRNLLYVFPYSYRFLMCPLSKFNGVILAQLLHNY
jgi:hypothetical protein